MTVAKKAYENYKPAGLETGRFPLVENCRVLEIGFGSGVLLKALIEKGNDAYGVDVGADIVKKAREAGLKNVELADISEEPLPYKDDFFDAVYCYEVFEHLTNPHRLFYEIRRTLKAEHDLYFSVPSQEMTMGYGPDRHSFVYPGLLERENLERFFMQMYFRVENKVEDQNIGIVHRSYILKNMKREGLPDIVKIITGDHNVEQLYGHMLGPEELEREILHEIKPYLHILEKLLAAGELEPIDDVLNVLLTFYLNHYFMYFELSEIFAGHGQAGIAKSLLEAMLKNENLPDTVREEAKKRLGGIA